MKEQPDRLERELKEMLAVNPSSDLPARIRARAFSRPMKRISWFAWTSGLAAATVAVFLIAIYHQPNVPEVPPSPPAIAAKPDIPAPTAVTEAPIQIRQTRKVKKQAESTNEATAVLATPSTAGVPLQAAEIELPTLKGLELKSSIQPIPQPTPFAIASLQPLKIEPPILTVPNLE